MTDYEFLGRLNDKMIKSAIEKGLLKIEPFDEQSLKSASYDVTFGNTFLIRKPWVLVISSTEDQEKNMLRIDLPRNTEASLKDDRLYNGKGLFWDIRRFLFSAKRFFLAGVDKHGYYLLMPPFSLVLGYIRERVTLSEFIEVILDGKSSGGREGISAHVTAGYGDIKYCGNMTTETVNPMLCFIKLYPDSFIGQLRFNLFGKKCDRGYDDPSLNSHYQNDHIVKASTGLKIKRK